MYSFWETELCIHSVENCVLDKSIVPWKLGHLVSCLYHWILLFSNFGILWHFSRRHFHSGHHHKFSHDIREQQRWSGVPSWKDSRPLPEGLVHHRPGGRHTLRPFSRWLPHWRGKFRRTLHVFWESSFQAEPLIIVKSLPIDRSSPRAFRQSLANWNTKSH